MRGALSFPSRARVLRTAEYRNIYEHGFRVPGSLFVAFCLARTGEDANSGARLGITVPRAIGKANVRNRIKRRLRESFRLLRGDCHPQWDIVLNPRRAAADKPFLELQSALEKVINRCNSHS